MTFSNWLREFFQRASRKTRARTKVRRLGALEVLEERTLLSGSPFVANFTLFNPSGNVPAGSANPVASAFTPARMAQAYGINFAAIGDGTGVTIAIVDAYDNPRFVSRSATLPLDQDTAFLASDLHQFDLQYNLPEPPGFFTKLNQSGGTTYPGTDTVGPGHINWEAEIALDVEWVHAMAPAAKIILVESNDNNDSIFTAVAWAASQSGAQAVSMSWGGDEDASELSLDSTTFVSPAGHGVTFLASTGDTGRPGLYPAYSPNVVAVGGTKVNVTSGGNYISEDGWAGSGGGISQFESQPAYQSGLTPSSTMRTIPDIAFDADPVSGVSVYDSYNGDSTGGPWYQFGGTSVSAPCMAALVALADGKRIAAGLDSLNGSTQTLPILYALPSSDLHDITTGNNGFAAGPGYDLVTGLGSPIPSTLIPDLDSLRVYASTPDDSATVNTLPTMFTVTFTAPINPNTVQASDLKVDGIGAASVTLNAAGTTAMFTYPDTPVTASGAQTISLAAGSISAAANSAVTNAAFSSTFTFAPLALTVIAPNNQIVYADTPAALSFGSFTGPDPSASPWLVDINLGDGSADIILTTFNFGTLGTVNHTYPTLGAYALTITVTDGLNAIGSATTTLMVTAAPTTTTLTSNGPSPSLLGQPVSFSVCVTGGAAVSGDTVMLVDAANGNALVGVGSLSGGSAVVTVSNLSAGPHSIFAVYSGDSIHIASGSSTVAQTVHGLTSNIGALPTFETSASFSVFWSGTAGPGWSLAGYTIYVSDNFGPYTPWLTNTTQTSAVYLGQNQHTYAFYSVSNGTDDLNNAQTAPPSATTSTTIHSGPVTTLVVTSLTPTPTGFSAVFSKPLLNTTSNPVHLYSAGASNADYGPANVKLVGRKLGPVNGSLILNSDNTGFTFIKTNLATGGGTSGLLAPDSYTVTFFSGAQGFRDTNGNPLDGDSSGIGGANYTSTFVVGGTPNIVFDGNSLTVGQYASSPDKSYPAQLASANPTWIVNNAAANGLVTEDLVSRGVQFVDSLYNISASTNIVVAWEGINSLNRVPEGPNSAYAAMTSYITARKAAGWKVVLLTTIAAAPTAMRTGWNADRLLLNGLYIANSAGADAVLDIASDPRLSDPENLTYYIDDGIHLNNTGYGVVASLVSTALASLIAPSQPGVTVSIPDFARGPNSADSINLVVNSPNPLSGGIPVALNIPAGESVTSAVVTIQYHSSQLIINSAFRNPALTVASFTSSTTVAGGNATTVLTFNSPAPLSSGHIVLGGLVAYVPSSAPYRSKQLLQINSVINGGALPAINDGAVQVVAFPGNASGGGTYSSNDSGKLLNVASGADVGFALFPALDPAILGDLTGNGSVDAGDVVQLNVYNAWGSNPAFVPSNPGVQPSVIQLGPDPTLSIPSTLSVNVDGTVLVPVNIDDPKPPGSAGMTLAQLALRYDPRKFSVSSQDVQLGSVPAAGTGWSLQAVVDQTTGQIGITLASLTPIGTAAPGSLVVITFHQKVTATPGATAIDLVRTVTPNGRGFATTVDDNQGPFTLTPAPTNSSTVPGLEGTVILVKHPRRHRRRH